MIASACREHEERVGEAGRRIGMFAEVEQGLDQLELHEHELAVHDAAIHTGIEERVLTTGCGVERAPRLLDHVHSRILDRGGAAVLGLDAEVPAAGALERSVAERSANEDQ